jgi:uncharacterized protein YfaT (DUF1175 family)
LLLVHSCEWKQSCCFQSVIIFINFLTYFVGSVVPGAGAFEIAAYTALMKFKDTVKGRARLGKRNRQIMLFDVNSVPYHTGILTNLLSDEMQSYK